MVPTTPLAAGTLGGLLLVVYLAAVLYLYLLLVDIRRNTKETAETLDRIAARLDDADAPDDGEAGPDDR